MSSAPREHVRRIARRYGLAIVGALLLQGVLFLAWRARAPAQEERPGDFHVTTLGAMEPAPDVGFVRLDGATVALQSLRGHVVLVHFWATWCPPCRRELPALLDRARRHDGLVILLVAVRDDLKGLRRFFGGSIPAEVVFDPAGEVVRRFGAATLPDTFLVSRAGILTQRLRGSRDWGGEGARRFLAEATGRVR